MGYADAQYNLGVMYHKEKGVPQDDKTAVKWYRLAAEQGHAVCPVQSGCDVRTGKGVRVFPQDYKTAVKWYRLAAEQGKLTITLFIGFILGVLYMTAGQQGLDGEYFRALQTVSGAGID